MRPAKYGQMIGSRMYFSQSPTRLGVAIPANPWNTSIVGARRGRHRTRNDRMKQRRPIVWRERASNAAAPSDCERLTNCCTQCRAVVVAGNFAFAAPSSTAGA